MKNAVKRTGRRSQRTKPPRSPKPVASGKQMDARIDFGEYDNTLSAAVKRHWANDYRKNWSGKMGWWFYVLSRAYYSRDLDLKPLPQEVDAYVQEFNKSSIFGNTRGKIKWTDFLESKGKKFVGLPTAPRNGRRDVNDFLVLWEKERRRRERV